MEKIYELAYQLNQEISSDSRVILLDEIEKKMNDDEEVMALSYKKDVAVDNYEFALNHFGEKSKEVEEAQKKLHEAKLALDSHPVVREYLEAYGKVRDMYFEINELLFSMLNRNLCEIKK